MPRLIVAWNFFGSIPEQYKTVLTPAFEKIQLAPNERLIQQGEPGDCLYILLKGQLRVIDEDLDESENFLTFKEPGEGVGEISLLTGERRTATVDAVIASELVVLIQKKPGSGHRNGTRSKPCHLRSDQSARTSISLKSCFDYDERLQRP